MSATPAVAGPEPTVTDSPVTPIQYGELAERYCHVKLPLQVLKSAAGYYLGTWDDEGPCSRESVEYWSMTLQAELALASGQWTQRTNP